MKVICQHFIVSGRVQGVWFRANTKKKAEALGLTGWVRNLANGDVEVVARGPETIVAEFQEWLWQGPELAKVTAVQCKAMALENFTDFSVK